MNPNIVTKLKRLVAFIGPLLAIELFLPGGTLIVLACLLMGHSLPAPVLAHCKWLRKQWPGRQGEEGCPCPGLHYR